MQNILRFGLEALITADDETAIQPWNTDMQCDFLGLY